MCTQQHPQTTLHWLSQIISFISDHQRCYYLLYCIDPTNLAAYDVLSSKHSSPYQEVLNPWLYECDSCDTECETELLALVVLQSLRVHNKTRSAALLIQALAGGMRPLLALLVLSLLLLILIYSSCEYCSDAHWLVLSNSDASQLRWLSTAAQRGWDQWSTARKTARWAGTRVLRCDMPEEMRFAQCVFVCFLAARNKFLIWTQPVLFLHVDN